MFPLICLSMCAHKISFVQHFTRTTYMKYVGVRTFRPRTIRPFIVKNGISLFIGSWIYEIILG